MKEKVSKRIWGSICIGLGIIMKVILFWMAIKVTIKDPITAISVSNMLMWTGGGLLGLDLVKQIKK